MIPNLPKNILATVAYFDALDYAPTAFEIWKYLVARDESDGACGLSEVVAALETESVRRSLGCVQGMYFFHGRKKLIEKRLEREKLSIAKYRGVYNLAKRLRYIPFVRMIALTGSLSMKNSDQDGDWDLLIALRNGHIWMGRLLLAGLLHVLGWRRHGESVADRACLNYWITDQSLEVMTRDLFSSNEYFFALPVFGFETFAKFREKNTWMKRFRLHYEERVSEASTLCVKNSFFAKLVRDSGEVLLGDRAFERWLGRLQKKKIQNNPLTKLLGSLIIADDRALIFLPKPQGPKVFEKYRTRLSETGAL